MNNQYCPKIASIESIDAGRAVKIIWQDHKEVRFHAFWLRDNAFDAKTRDPGNGQKLITIFDLDFDATIDCIQHVGDTLNILFAGDETLYDYPIKWLFDHRYDHQQNKDATRLIDDKKPWTTSFQNDHQSADYGDLSTKDEALLEWLSQIDVYGFACLKNMPVQSGAVCDVAELFGHVRETNYGRWFEVRAEAKPINLAYTGLGLPLHSDNPYRDPAPTLQLLACLENSAEGGDSILSDGFNAAITLEDQDPDAFALLTDHSANFAYESGGVTLKAKRPMIELSPEGKILSVRVNSRSIAALTDMPYDQMKAYYKAYRKFIEILEDPGSVIQFKMRSGDLFIVDNCRVLHSRTGFSGAGNRWLQGCYADMDGLRSTLARLENNLSSA